MMRTTMEGLWRNRAPREDDEPRLIPAPVTSAETGPIIAQVRGVVSRVINWFTEY
ncbi:MAG: hypothetical protein V3W41_01220 [Planctomycetota bacterium]